MADTRLSPLQIHQFPCLQDNYGFLLHDPEANVTAVVDTPDVAAIEAALMEKGSTSMGTTRTASKLPSWRFSNRPTLF